jgi:hypothetical protein
VVLCMVGPCYTISVLQSAAPLKFYYVIFTNVKQTTVRTIDNDNRDGDQPVDHMGLNCGCYDHFFISSPLSSYLLILSISHSRPFYGLLLITPIGFTFIYHMQIFIVHISFTSVSLLFHFLL